MYLEKQDPCICRPQTRRQETRKESLEMIASENFVYRKQFSEAYHSTLTNKYAEGYPGKDNITAASKMLNRVEELAIERKNVQHRVCERATTFRRRLLWQFFLQHSVQAIHSWE